MQQSGPPSDRAQIIAALIARQPTRSTGTIGLLHQICVAAVQVLAASGAGVSVMTGAGVRGASAASDPTSEHLEELQFVLGEGPCMDAFKGRRPVLIADLKGAADTRWPFYTPAAYDGGLRAVFAFPLQIGAARLGVLDVFRERTGPLTGPELADAFTVADAAVTALLDQNGGRFTAADLEDADQYRSELFQAQGMVMVQLGGTLEEAMARIRAYAFAEDRRLGEVAKEIVARRLHFERDD